MRFMHPSALQHALLSKTEIAVLDIREARDFARAHLNLSTHLPFSQLELRVKEVVPRQNCRVVLCGNGSSEDDPLPSRAMAVLASLGYTDVQILDGGIAKWMLLGYSTSDGYATFPRAFGDEVRKHFKAPSITPMELKSRLVNGRPTTLIDVRTAEELAFSSIGGTHHAPGVELATLDLENDDPDHLWVINCFSRTRGILGATMLQELRKIPDVVFLEDGLMSWQAHGYETLTHQVVKKQLPRLNKTDMTAVADRIQSENGIATLRRDDWITLREDARKSNRTVFHFDVRQSPGKSGSRLGIVSMPGGQLIMHYDVLVGVRNAIIVLIDDAQGLRGLVTAFWLKQMGDAQVFVLPGSEHNPEIDFDPLPAPSTSAALEDLSISVEALAVELREGRVSVVDVGPSAEYERVHLPKAYFAVRSALWDLIETLNAFSHPIVLTSPDGLAASLGARDLAANLIQPVRWLKGGTAAWADARQPVETTVSDGALLTPYTDDWGAVMRMPKEGLQSRYAEFLRWERAVPARVTRDQTVRFQLNDPAAHH